MKFPLQIKVGVVLFGALIALQLGLASLFSRATDQAIAVRTDALSAQITAALDALVAEAALAQAAVLAPLVDIARNQDAVQVETIQTVVRERTSTRSPRRRATVRERTETTTSTQRLADGLERVREYVDADGSALWFATPGERLAGGADDSADLTDMANLEALGYPGNPDNRALRAAAKSLAAGDQPGPLHSLRCTQRDCALLTAQRFQSQDGVRITAFTTQRLSALLARQNAANALGLVLDAKQADATSSPAADSATAHTTAAPSDPPIDPLSAANSPPPFADPPEQARSGFRLPASVGGIVRTGPALRIAADADPQIARLKERQQQFQTLSLAGAVISILLITLILRGPIRRIARLAQGLPRLADGQFGDAASIFEHRPPTIRDETDDVLALAARVTQTLSQTSHGLKHRTQELAQERDDIALILQTVPAAVIVIDQGLNIYRRNPSLDSLLGIAGYDTSSREPEGTPRTRLCLAPWLSEADALRMKAAVTQTARGVKVSRIETQLIPPRKPATAVVSPTTAGQTETARATTVEWRFAALQARTQHGASGSAGQVLAIGRDLTNQRDAEARLQWASHHDAGTGLLNRSALLASFQIAPHASTELLAWQPADAAMLFAALSSDDIESLAASIARHLCDDRNDQDAPPAAPLESWARVGRLKFAARTADGAASLERLQQALSQPCVLPGERSYRIKPQWVRVANVHPAGPSDVADLADVATTFDRAELLPAAFHRLAQPAAAQRIEPPTETWDARALVRDYLLAERHWVAEIQAALDEQRLFLDYHAIYPAAQTANEREHDRVPAHFEALARLRNADGSITAPGDFIPAAERSGQIIAIEHRVFELALDALSARSDLCVAVNLAVRALLDDYILSLVSTAIETVQIRPQQLIIEIVETEAIDNLESAHTRMQAYRDLGVRIALDDFGVGFTSFEYLRDLPFDTVKIDQAFVRNLHTSAEDQRLVRSIIDMVGAMGKTVVAEGVESQAAADWLTDSGVDYLQGYHFGWPGALPEPS